MKTNINNGANSKISTARLAKMKQELVAGHPRRIASLEREIDSAKRDGESREYINWMLKKIEFYKSELLAA